MDHGDSQGLLVRSHTEEEGTAQMNSKNAARAATVADETPRRVPNGDLPVAEHERLNQLYAKAAEVLFTAGYQVSDAEYAELRATIKEARMRADRSQFRVH